MNREYPEWTVPQEICSTHNFNPQCPYSTKQQIKNYLDKVRAEAVYKNLANPEDMLELNNVNPFGGEAQESN